MPKGSAPEFCRGVLDLVASGRRVAQVAADPERCRGCAGLRRTWHDSFGTGTGTGLVERTRRYGRRRDPCRHRARRRHPDRFRCRPGLGTGAQVLPRVALRCPDCEHGVHAKVCPREAVLLRHNPGRPAECAWDNESLEHHRLRLEPATTIRELEWHTEVEVRVSTAGDAPTGRVSATIGESVRLRPGDQVSNRSQRLRSCSTSPPATSGGVT